MATNDIVLVLTTCPNDDRAEALARALVEERLAACVNVHGPVVSVYRWQNAVERDVERQIVIKTTRDFVTAVEARIRALHGYDLPEFLVLSVEGGSDAYLDWVRRETGGSG